MVVRPLALELRLGNAGMRRNHRIDRLLNGGVGRARWQIGLLDHYSPVPQVCSASMPSCHGLDVSGIDFAHRAVDSEVLAMLVQLFPDGVVGVGVAVGSFKIGGAAVAVAAGRYAAAVE